MQRNGGESVSKNKAMAFVANLRVPIMSETVQLNPGDTAPAFTALDEQGNEHTLQAYLDLSLIHI